MDRYNYQCFSKSFRRVLSWTKQKWVNTGSEFYNRSTESWLQDNDTEMYSTYNKGKSAVTARFMRTSFKKISNIWCLLTSKSVYINKLDGLVNKCNNTYHRTIKMKSFDLKASTYFDFSIENIEIKN